MLRAPTPEMNFGGKHRAGPAIVQGTRVAPRRWERRMLPALGQPPPPHPLHPLGGSGEGGGGGGGKPGTAAPPSLDTPISTKRDAGRRGGRRDARRFSSSALTRSGWGAAAGSRDTHTHTHTHTGPLLPASLKGWLSPLTPQPEGMRGAGLTTEAAQDPLSNPSMEKGTEAAADCS